MKLTPPLIAIAFTALVSNAVLAQEAGSAGGSSGAMGGGQSQRYDADNTGQNELDRQRGKLEATDQSNDAGDVDLTAQIRRAITDDDSLSVNAHNVKIITQDGAVTLRGPVDSAQERQRVEEIARRIAGQQKVVNELEINQQ